MTINAANEAQAAAYLEFTLGDRLTRSLRHADLGVSEMAEILGVSRETIGRWMNDRGTPKRAGLLAWAAITNVSVEWLETGRAPVGGTNQYHTEDALTPGVVVAFRSPNRVRASLTANRRTGLRPTRHLRSVS